MISAVALQPDQRKQAAMIWARSFFDYPSIVYSWPDPQQRERHLAQYFGWALNYGFRYGEIYTTPDIAGVSIWLPPWQTQITTWRYMWAGYLQLPLVMKFSHIFTRTMRNEKAVHTAHQKIISRPHWYLWGIAVDPDQQGKGIGRTLLQPGLGKADAVQLPCYLETHDEGNLPYYAKYGFELVRNEEVPDSDLRFWCFLREPQN